MLGKPRYNYMDEVVFELENDHGVKVAKRGKVYIIDAYGTFENNTEPSYDVLVEDENVLYKHIGESCIVM